MELEPDGKHQQDHPDLSELFGKVLICDEPRRVGANQETCDQISDNRGKPGAVGHISADHRECEGAREQQDQVDRVHRTILRGQPDPP